MEMNGRVNGVTRPYTKEDVERLRGTVHVEHTLARLGAERLWELLAGDGFVRSLGALSGGQAVQMVKAGLQSIYVSGWQVAADANLSGHTYPDQSLYPANSAPALVRRINNALLRADQIHTAEGDTSTYWLVPIVADAEAGFGGPLNAFELMKAMIEAGAAGVHFEDQLASEKKCGHLGGKVLVPTSQFIRTLVAARLAADVLDVPTVRRRPHRLALRDAADERRRRARRRRSSPASGRRRASSASGAGLDVVDRPLARLRAVRRHALVRDVDARPRRGPRVRAGDQRAVPGQAAHVQLLAVVQLATPPRRRPTSRRFQEQLAGMGYTYQFVTLAGFHALNASMFELAHGYATEGMAAYVRLQEHEFALEEPATRPRATSASRRRLLRRGRRGGHGRRVVDARAEGLDRGGAVRQGGGA